MDGHVLIGFGSSWRYVHEDEPAPANWTTPEFDDSKWQVGTAPLGYGTNEIGTRIYPGESFKRRPPAAFFRAAFEAEEADLNPSTPLSLGVHRNTSVRVYLNGTLVAWDGIPSTAASFDVPIKITSTSDTSRFPLQFSLTQYKHVMRRGRNILAVALRHSTREYSKLTFDAALATGPGPIDRVAFASGVSPPLRAPIAAGALAPDFEWLDVPTGTVRKLSEFYGEPFLLQFSGAECKPCWKKIPFIRRWSDAGLKALSISSWGTVGDMAVSAQRHQELLRGITVGAEAQAYDPYQTSCYRDYGMFNGSVLVGADKRVRIVATGFSMDEFLRDVEEIDRDLRTMGFQLGVLPQGVGIVGTTDWRVVTLDDAEDDVSDLMHSH